MTENRRGQIDFFQNVAIAALAVSAVMLFTRTEIFQPGWQTLRDEFRLFPEETVAADRGPETAGLAVPVRVAVTGSYGRYAAVTRTTGDGTFQILEDAFRSGGELETGTRSGFLRALDNTSLYCDFLCPLPLSLLAGLAGLPSPPEEEGSFRYTVLAREGTGVILYLWDGGENYCRRRTDISLAELEELAGHYEEGNAWFAMDRAAEDTAYQSAAPLSLFPREVPALPVLSASDGGADAERLLTVLRFNPLTHSRYLESNGTEVIREGVRSVRIRRNGSVYYQGGGRPEVRVECAGEIPTAWEAAVGCAALLEALLELPDGASIFPLEVARDGERTVLKFGYQAGGVPVRFSDGGSAAVVVLERANVSILELRPRRYAALEEESAILPLAQVLGIAVRRDAAELSLGYVDSGETRLNARWLSG